jgi:SAM-dependent methyltransferase
VDGMRRELVSAQPTVACISCVAEALPLASSSIAAISVAQAFHWFDADRAMDEAYRVIQPGGSIAMLWNARLRHVDWVDQVWGVMDRVEKHAPWRNHDHVATGDANAFREDDLAAHAGFGNLRTAQFVHEQPTTPEGVVARVKGVSHVAVLGAEEQASVLDEVRSILATHPDTSGRQQLAIPYRVDCYALTRTPAPR